MNSTTTNDWVAPGPGSWALDDTHKTTSYTRPYADIAVPAIGDGFAAIGNLYGLPFERLELATVRGRMYARMVITGAPAPKAGKVEQAPPAFVLRILSRLHPALRRRAAIATRAVAERRWRVEADRWWTTARAVRIAANVALQARVVEAATNANDAGAAALADLVEATAANLRAGTTHHFRMIGVQLGVTRLLAFLADHHVDPAAAGRLLTGASPASSATQAVVDAARDAVRAAGGRGPWADVDELRVAAPAAAEIVDAHLATHGHRIVGASDLDGATLLEHPDLLLAAIASPSTSPSAGPAPTDPAPAGPGDDRVVAIRAALPDDGARARFDDLLDDAVACFAVREDEVGISLSWSAGLCRRALLLAGDALVGAGRLERATDVFELDVAELVALLRDEPDAPDRAAVVARRLDRAAADAEVAPRWLGSPPVEPPPPSVFPPALADLVRAFSLLHRQIDAEHMHDAGVTTTGIGIGDRVHRGRARVAASPDDLLTDLEPGDVLVTSITTPAFNAVLPLLGAIVTERGGLLSHPAIAARELDVPAVIGAPGVLTTIPDRAIVVVDPVAGTVTVAERPALEPTRPRA